MILKFLSLYRLSPKSWYKRSGSDSIIRAKVSRETRQHFHIFVFDASFCRQMKNEISNYVLCSVFCIMYNVLLNMARVTNRFLLSSSYISAVSVVTFPYFVFNLSDSTNKDKINSIFF